MFKANTKTYFAVLFLLTALLIGPLTLWSAAFMNFRIGFWTGSSLIAGLLGSVVILLYGSEGKHGANYIQTMACTMGSMGAMSVLLQAMHWLELPEPAMWKMMVYLALSGGFGIFVGMLYTPLLVDNWKLPYPTGKAVADILTALTDVNILKRALAWMSVGLFSGFAVGRSILDRPLSLFKIRLLPITPHWQPYISLATFGGGMIVGARVAVPGFVMGLIGWAATPYLQSIGWLKPDEMFYRIGFIIALAMILGSSLVHVTPVIWGTGRRLVKEGLPKGEETNYRLLIGAVAWGVALALFTSFAFDIRLLYVAAAIGLTVSFILINGISCGLTDSNPISSAFVISVLIVVLFGVDSAIVGLMCCSIVLVATSAGVDMQQDRSTGWRLGTNRKIQFRFNLLGALIGAPLAVPVAHLFLSTFPVLNSDTSGSPEWGSAMTLKIVGVLKGIGHYQPHQVKALLLGAAIGMATELMRSWLRKRKDAEGNLCFAKNKGLDFVVDAIVLPSPLASSFGGFVALTPTLLFAAGGVASSVYLWLAERFPVLKMKGVPADMNPSALIGGGLIAGESLAFIYVSLQLMLESFS